MERGPMRSRIRDIKEEYPVIVKEVPLSDEDCKRLLRRVSGGKRAIDLVTKLIEQVLDDTAIVEEEGWDECARLAGYKSLAEVNGLGLQMTCDPRGFIQIRAEEGSPPSSPKED
jgi:hypothetical protein